MSPLTRDQAASVARDVIATRPYGHIPDLAGPAARSLTNALLAGRRFHTVPSDTWDAAQHTILATTQVSVVNPDDPFASPAYDGPAAQAHTRLAPGTYQATDEDGEPVTLVVTETSTEVTRRSHDA